MRDGFQIFDAHMHYAGIFMQKGETLNKFMDRNGIDRAVVSTLNTTANMTDFGKTASVISNKYSQNPAFELFEAFRVSGQPDHSQVDALLKQYPDRIYPFFWYNPNDPHDPSQEKGLLITQARLEAGYRGIKIQLAMTPAPIDRLDPIACLCEKKGVPLYIHPSGGLLVAKRTNPFDLALLAKRHPAMNIIIGHAASTMEFCIEVVLAFQGLQNVYFETSTSIPFGIMVFIKTFGPDKVLFGSDTPPAGPFECEYTKVALLGISEEVKGKVFSDNICRLLHIEK